METLLEDNGNNKCEDRRGLDYLKILPSLKQKLYFAIFETKVLFRHFANKEH